MTNLESQKNYFYFFTCSIMTNDSKDYFDPNNFSLISKVQKYQLVYDILLFDKEITAQKMRILLAVTRHSLGYNKLQCYLRGRLLQYMRIRQKDFYKTFDSHFRNLVKRHRGVFSINWRNLKARYDYIMKTRKEKQKATKRHLSLLDTREGGHTSPLGDHRPPLRGSEAPKYPKSHDPRTEGDVSDKKDKDAIRKKATGYRKMRRDFLEKKKF